MIHVESLTRRYGELTAVKDVSFSIGRGEVVGLLGHNGAGKTTIMKMITKVEAVDSTGGDSGAAPAASGKPTDPKN